MTAEHDPPTQKLAQSPSCLQGFAAHCWLVHAKFALPQSLGCAQVAATQRCFESQVRPGPQSAANEHPFVQCGSGWAPPRLQ